MRRTVALAMVGSIALTGCDGLAGCGNEDPQLVLGTGADASWVEITSGDPADIIEGGQGGFHVDAAGRIGPVPQEAQLSGSLTIEGAPTPEVAVAVPFNQFLAGYDDSTCEGEFYGLQLRIIQQFNDPMIIRNNMNGQTATMEVTVAELGGTNPVTESIDVRLRFQR